MVDGVDGWFDWLINQLCFFIHLSRLDNPLTCKAENSKSDMTVGCSASPVLPDPDVEAAAAPAVDEDTAAGAAVETATLAANAPPTDSLSKGVPYRPLQDEKR